MKKLNTRDRYINLEYLYTKYKKVFINYFFVAFYKDIALAFLKFVI